MSSSNSGGSGSGRRRASFSSSFGNSNRAQKAAKNSQLMADLSLSPMSSLGVSAGTGESKPSAANSKSGWNELKSNLRSVVMSEVSYGMAQHCAAEPVAEDSKYKNVFKTSSEGNQKETAFTSNVVSKANHISPNGVHGEWNVSLRKNGQRSNLEGKLDVVVIKPHPNALKAATARPVLAVMEVGLYEGGGIQGKQRFMEKMHQGQAYVSLLLDPTLTGTNGADEKIGTLTMDGPILLGVVVYDATRDDQPEMLLGLFCCEKRDSSSFRISLMYNAVAGSRDAADKAFATLFDRIDAFAGILDAQRAYAEWRYLGPNCAMVRKHGEQAKVRIVYIAEGKAYCVSTISYPTVLFPFAGATCL
jgi:hypothetical protein